MCHWVPLIPLLLAFNLTAADNTFELSGKVRIGEKGPGKLTVAVYLEGATSPYSAHTLTDPAGNYKFKNVEAGMYRLTVVVAGWGQTEETVSIGPSTADRRGRIKRDVRFQKSAGFDGGATVSATDLTLSRKAARHYEKADERLSRRDVDGAIRELEEAVKESPTFSAAWNRLGTIAFQSSRFTDAERYFTEALRHDPASYPPKVNLGAAQFALGKLEPALETNREAVKARPDDPLAHSQLGQVLFALGRPDSAEDSLRMAKSLDPGHFSWPQLVLAEIYRRRQDFHSMAAELSDFLKHHPDSPPAPQLTELLEGLRREGFGAGDKP